MTQQDRTAVQYHKMTETPIPRLILSLAAPGASLPALPARWASFPA